jgi:signal transduction histidine kinase
VIVALEVPLALNLERRAEAEAASVAQGQAQVIASIVGTTIAEDGEFDPGRFDDELADFAERVDGRVIIVDEEGVLLADSEGLDAAGELYATSDRPELVRAVRDDVPAREFRFSETLGQDIIASAVPVFVGDDTEGAVRITQSLERVRANVRRTMLGLIAIGAAGLAAGLLIAFVVARSFSRPLSRLAAAAGRLGRGDLSARTGRVGGARELDEVGRSFDEMAGRLEATVRAQREFVANASHQLRTPLTGMKLRLEAALADESVGDELRAQLEAADREVDRLSGLVDRLLLLARRAETAGEHHADVREAALRAVRRWEVRAREARAALEVVGEGVLASVEAADLDQMLDVLIDNAIAYAGGSITLETGSTDAWAVLAVRDRGPGIPDDERDRVLERFYRGRGSPPGGTGLGLAIVRELAERWSGGVAISSADGDGEEGTRIEVRLPIAQAPAAEGSGPSEGGGGS